MTYTQAKGTTRMVIKDGWWAATIYAGIKTAEVFTPNGRCV